MTAKVPVEHLRVGDRVVQAGGRRMPTRTRVIRTAPAGAVVGVLLSTGGALLLDRGEQVEIETRDERTRS